MAKKGRTVAVATKTRTPDPQEVLLGDKGRLVLPAAIRRALGLKKGERLVVLVNKRGRLEVKTIDQVMADVRGMKAHLAPLTDDE